MKHALLVSFLVLAPALVAQTPRRPRGVYAKVEMSDYIALQQNANPCITAAELDAAFDSLYEHLLTNPAISGLTLQIHWDAVNPNPPSDANPYEWSYVDDAFAQVAACEGNISQPFRKRELSSLPQRAAPVVLLST